MTLDLNDVVSLLFLLVGAAVALVGVIRYFRGGPIEAVDSVAPPTQPATSRKTWGAALFLALLSVALGLEGIERRGMTHVEVYVPGIELPAEISEPPPRIGLMETVMWHFHSEPHPQGYYFLMWGWTKVFGTSLTALRLPSVLFGGLAVLMLFAAVSPLYGRSVALLSAALLAINGHHVYWTQHARMYELSLLLGVMSLWLLSKLLRGSASRRIRIGYVLVTTAGLYTQVFFWPFLAGQMTFAFFARRAGSKLPDAFSLQILVAMLGSPMWAQAFYHARNEPQNFTTWAFVQDYLNFGFLFRPDKWSLIPRDVPFLSELVLTVIAVGCVVLFVRSRSFRWHPPIEGSPATPLRGLWLVALGLVMVLYGISREVYSRGDVVALSMAVPLVALTSLIVARRLAPRVSLLASRPAAFLAESPFLTTALVTVGLVFLIGIVHPFLVTRGLLVAVPPLLVVLAGGLIEAVRRYPPLGIAAGLVVLAACGLSVWYYRGIPEPNDHRSLASSLVATMEPGDVILVPSRDWVTTPVFYHLQGEHHRLIGQNYQEAVAQASAAWVLVYSEIPIPQDIVTALEGLVPDTELTSLRSRAIRYRAPSPTRDDTSP